MTDDALEALELIRRVEASDVSEPTLDRLALAVDVLCQRYASTPPTVLLRAVRQYRRYIAHLLDARATLAHKRQLMVIGGWLSLLAAVIHEDLGQHEAAVASRDTARQLGLHTHHNEIIAWSFEVQAWHTLLGGRYREAVELCQAGQRWAGPETSAQVQLTTQEARAWARLRQTRETHRTLERAGALVARLPLPEQADHHFVFDPRKLTSYAATALTWLRDDGQAEKYCREVIRAYDEEHKPRRLATARIDLALVVARQDRPEEASQLGHVALASGRFVPSNIWRVAELDRALVERYGDLSEVQDLHERYVEVRRGIVESQRERYLEPDGEI